MSSPCNSLFTGNRPLATALHDQVMNRPSMRANSPEVLVNLAEDIAFERQRDVVEGAQQRDEDLAIQPRLVVALGQSEQHAEAHLGGQVEQPARLVVRPVNGA